MVKEQNSRNFSRVFVKVTVNIYLENPSRKVAGELRDISMNGAYIICPGHDISVGTTCRLVFLLRMGTEESVEIETQGKVTRIQEDGIAVAFTSIESDSFEYLQDLVRYNAENINVVEEELENSIGIHRCK